MMHIHTSGPPVATRVRRLSPKVVFEHDMLELGIIRPSSMWGLLGTPDHYSSASLHGTNIFSCVSPNPSWIRRHPEDSTLWIVFEFVHMPFWLKNTAQTFQRFMDQVQRGLNFCYGYIDDLLVASKTLEERYQGGRMSQSSIIINAPQPQLFGSLSWQFWDSPFSSLNPAANSVYSWA